MSRAPLGIALVILAARAATAQTAPRRDTLRLRDLQDAAAREHLLRLIERLGTQGDPR